MLPLFLTGSVALCKTACRDDPKFLSPSVNFILKDETFPGFPQDPICDPVDIDIKKAAVKHYLSYFTFYRESLTYKRLFRDQSYNSIDKSDFQSVLVLYGHCSIPGDWNQVPACKSYSALGLFHPDL
uniref:Uncharacterized protein n=1 Tax=Micrurus lemniscatus lemniscatus TaxID=129467 RepID=A0A2D4IFP0_MICLE